MMSGMCGPWGEEVSSKLPVPERRQEACVRVPRRRGRVGSGGGGGQLSSLPGARTPLVAASERTCGWGRGFPVLPQEGLDWNIALLPELLPVGLRVVIYTFL